MAQPAKYLIQPKNSRQTIEEGKNSSTTGEKAPQLLAAALKILEPFVGEGVKLLIENNGQTSRIVIYRSDEKQPCDQLRKFNGVEGESILVCPKLDIDGISLSSKKHSSHNTGKSKDKEVKRLVIERIGNIIENLSLDDLCGIQSLQYKCTHKINTLKTKTKTKTKTPKRPIKEQRKVGDYLYLLQPGQKGGDYWYLHFTEQGKRRQIYLGKPQPLFEPMKDLARKQKSKSKAMSAHI